MKDSKKSMFFDKNSSKNVKISLTKELNNPDDINNQSDKFISPTNNNSSFFKLPSSKMKRKSISISKKIHSYNKLGFIPHFSKKFNNKNHHLSSGNLNLLINGNKNNILNNQSNSIINKNSKNYIDN